MNLLKNWKLALLLLLIFHNAYANARESEVSYSISIGANNPKLATVQVSYIVLDSILIMAPGANQLPNRWATFVYNLKAENAKGESLIIKDLPGAEWRVHSPLDQRIVLTYDVKLNHEDYEWSSGIDGAAYANDLGVFYTGRSLFILTTDKGGNINLDFELPENWNLTTPWLAQGENPFFFTAPNTTSLAESILFAGLHEEISIKRDHFELVFALGGDEIITQKEEFKNLAEGVFDYYIDLMGGIPRLSGDREFKKSVVVINSSDQTDGEAIGNNISLLIDKKGDPMSKMISRFIFAHEFFHLWNGKSFIPEGDSTEWFKEGITNYYTLKSMYNLGLLDNQSYLGVLNDIFYQRYRTDQGIDKLSMTNGAEKHNHWGIISGGGLFVGIAQDMIIRRESKNTKSLDDLMRGLFQKYGGTTDVYSLDELKNSLSALSGIDQTDFFDKYVLGVERIPIAEYLTMAGLNARIENDNLIIQQNKQISKVDEKMIKGLFGY